MRWFGKRPVGLGGFELFKYLGPGFLVTVGFIDPGAANVT
jgi:hypothetical protein